MQEIPVELSKELEDHVIVHAIKDGAVQGETEDEITVPATKENKQEMPTSQEPLPTLPARCHLGRSPGGCKTRLRIANNSVKDTKSIPAGVPKPMMEAM